MSFICDKCDQEFPQTPQGKQDWLLHRATHDAPQGKVGLTATKIEVVKKSMSAAEIKKEKAVEKEKKDKLTLEYVWKGSCPTCGNYVETLEVDVGQPKGKTVVIAFCSVCKKQLVYRPVEKL